MKKTLLLSATAAILAGAFAPAVLADTTSGSTAAASSTPAPVSGASGTLETNGAIPTDNVMPIVSGTVNYNNFTGIQYQWAGAPGAQTASLSDGQSTATGSFSVQNLKTQNNWVLSGTYSDADTTTSSSHTVTIDPLDLNASTLTKYGTSTFSGTSAHVTKLTNGAQNFNGTITYTMTAANPQ
ncbi:hypothetical protein [Leuconostoc lactis]|uniref:hypothetical protein n=1 Tax=Leuconostoc lactis TaxID=1246 RepID=UPI0018977E0F|nr:hypothetical protein [Leuconostoc lactis]